MTEQSPGGPPPSLDLWIVSQLRAQVLTDLESFIPDNYFEQKPLAVYAPGDPSTKHLNYEIQWGHNAGTLGKKLTFETPVGLTARQVSASEVLMNLGLLAGAQSAYGIFKHADQRATEKGGCIVNPNLTQLPQTISVLENNLTQALRQYLNYLPPNEQGPFLPLLHSSPNDVRLSPNGYLNMTNQYYFGPVGSVMNGPGAVSNVQQWSDANRTVVLNSLQDLAKAIESTPETELTPELKVQLVGQITTKSGELQSAQPDKSKFLSWLDTLATTVKTVETLKPAFEFVKEVVTNVLT